LTPGIQPDRSKTTAGLQRPAVFFCAQEAETAKRPRGLPAIRGRPSAWGESLATAVRGESVENAVGNTRLKTLRNRNIPEFA
jgi:hypothetical protein